jgi:murein DD-endopeptidase MepM/ murein hydrolase activator NlpD
MRKLVLISALFFGLYAPLAFASSISVTPEQVLQGEPAKITIDLTNQNVWVKQMTIDGKLVSTFMYSGKPTALIGIDLNKKIGTSTILATLSNGQVLKKDFAIILREKYESPLGIPDSLGGNSTTSQQQLVNSLAFENSILNSIKTGSKAFWAQGFRYPVANPIVTDEYGYSRQTGSYTIAHKGTDFRAPIGTSVMAMNRGVVRIARPFRAYGNTIVVDHGLGVLTMYMHLSKMNVKEGQLVLPGQVIGKSGNTGYAEGAHLHLSIRINSISIDPMKFMAFFK